MLVLSPAKLIWRRGQGAIPVEMSAQANPSRDPRGRLRPSGAGFEAFLPGSTCRISIEPPAIECRQTDEPWVIESGSRALLVANYAATRNYFDGRIANQTGVRKTLAPFYSAAAVEENGRTLWLLSMLEGRTQIFDAALEPAGAISGWGSDIVGTDARCGGGAQVLATRPGDGAEPDAIQAFTLVNRAPSPLSSPIGLPGPVTALWPSGGNAAVAVVRDLATGKYAAYLITIACGA